MNWINCAVNCYGWPLTFRKVVSAATNLRGGDSFNLCFLCRSFLKWTVKKIWKLVHLCWSYGKNKWPTFFWDTVHRTRTCILLTEMALTCTVTEKCILCLLCTSYSKSRRVSKPVYHSYKILNKQISRQSNTSDNISRRHAISFHHSNGLLLATASTTNTTFGFVCLTSRISQRSLQVRLGPWRLPEEPLGIASAKFFISQISSHHWTNSVKALKKALRHHSNGLGE